MNHLRLIGNIRGHIIGRGHGRYHGRSNYYHTRSSTTNQETELNSPPQPPKVQGKSSYATYSTVKEAVVQQVQRTCKGGQDLAKSLEYLQTIDLQTAEPTRALSTKAIPAKHEI